jgi:tetraacyldisaccharide 4'-kinase
MQRIRQALLRPRGIAAGAVFLPLTLASYLYGFACRARASAYRVGIFRSDRLPCRVISVGNLTVGGTGKTPVVIHLAGLLLHDGRRVGVVSRGYGRRGRESEILVSDGQRLFATPEEAGEEPYLIARRLPGVPVMVASRRADAGKVLRERYGIDTLLLDDGFQHLSLRRDLNLLLIDATDPFGNGFVLPRGTLREPFSALSRADAVLLTRIEQNGGGISERLEGLLREIGRGYSLPVLRSSFCPTEVILLPEGEARGIGLIRGKKWFLLSGIGNPRSFRRSVEQSGGAVTGEMILRDHCRYSGRLLRKIRERAAATRPYGILTTEKDGVKIAPLLRQGIGSSQKLPILALRIELGKVEEAALFERLVLGK